MKCDCEECGGTGKVRCPECGGSGNYTVGIEHATIDPSHPHCVELNELKKDAKRVMLDADRLEKLRPERANSYRLQMVATLKTINSMANHLLAKSK